MGWGGRVDKDRLGGGDEKPFLTIVRFSTNGVQMKDGKLIGLSKLESWRCTFFYLCVHDFKEKNGSLAPSTLHDCFWECSGTIPDLLGFMFSSILTTTNKMITIQIPIQ